MGTKRKSFLSELESFGVRIRLEADEKDALERIIGRLRVVFGELISETESGVDPIVLRVSRSADGSFLVEDSSGEPERFFADSDLPEGIESLVRIKVGEYAPKHVFVHAGAVAISGKALILPGSTRSGKSTLVSELVRNGAEYLSDEYAVIDHRGMVSPFPKPLSIRSADAEGRQVDVLASDLGGKTCRERLECGMILFAEFRGGSDFKPKVISRAGGLMRILEHTVPIRKSPEYSLKVLNKLILRAIIVQSYRPEASEIAILLMEYFNREVISTP